MDTATASLSVGVTFDSDWHAHIDTPDRGPLGYCLGQSSEFDPAAATLRLAAEGWRVTGEWTETSAEEYYQYTAAVVPQEGVEIRDQPTADLLQHIGDLREQVQHIADLPDTPQHIADLLDTLQLGIRWIYFSAGHAVVADPELSERLLAAADDMAKALNRIAPHPG